MSERVQPVFGGGDSYDTERMAYGIWRDLMDDSLLSLVVRTCGGDARVALQT